jgi:hypothetical protein
VRRAGALRRGALAAFAVGAALMLFVEHTVAMASAIVLFLSAIVLGTFGLATPDALVGEDDEPEP